MTHRCPRCGTEMNHQADKLVDPQSREETREASVLGGIVVAVFACSGCGFVDAVREGDEEEA